MGLLNDIYNERKSVFKKGDYFYLDKIPGEKGRMIVEGFCHSNSYSACNSNVYEVIESNFLIEEIVREKMNKWFLVIYRYVGEKRLQVMNLNDRVLTEKTLNL
jgi:Fe-S cluster biosynthesis and repair protein YggX